MANDLLLGYGCILVTPGANETPSHVPTGALLRLPSHASERRRHEARIGCIGMHRSTSSICFYGLCFGTKPKGRGTIDSVIDVRAPGSLIRRSIEDTECTSLLDQEGVEKLS
ncbi:glutathione S-transferase [Aspergillus luchuensis]|uniref:Glutathione S-transferase n=1 Tax=Aspergillus kawachii TaxID=1069201 RepID=A0A146FDN7_ASPKA|nr:glutathione S-transferase [Aspergillus luchuensis]